MSATDDDKFHLVQQIADEVARKYRIDDPSELWSVGWIAAAAAMEQWRGEGPVLGCMRSWIVRAMVSEAARPQGRRRPLLTGSRRI
jgi:hypothetical protein